MSKAFDILKPKNIILSAIKEKLADTGVTKLVLIFAIETDQYKIMVSNEAGQSMKIDITQDDLTTIKKLFIKRIVSSWKLKYDDEIKDVIIQVDLNKNSLELYIQTPTDEVLKYNY